MKKNGRTALFLWVSLWVIFIGACLYFFLLLPEKTTTLTGSSAHWKAENVVHVQKLDSNFRTSSVDELKVWWMGSTLGEFSGVQYEISGLHGTIMKGNGASGSFNPWVIHLTDILLSEPQLEYGLVVTITLNDSTETIHLQRQ
jgi:hypothetical protein